MDSGYVLKVPLKEFYKRKRKLELNPRFLVRVTGMELPVTKITLWEGQIGSLEIKSYVLAILSLR